MTRKGYRVAGSRAVSTAKVGGTLTAGGLLVACVLTVVSGVQYRIQESRGEDPGWAPLWIVVGSYGGLVIAAAGVVIAVVGLAWMRVSRSPHRT